MNTILAIVIFATFGGSTNVPDRVAEAMQIVFPSGDYECFLDSRQCIHSTGQEVFWGYDEDGRLTYVTGHGQGHEVVWMPGMREVHTFGRPAAGRLGRVAEALHHCVQRTRDVREECGLLRDLLMTQKSKP